jgi:hypothetical protein
MSIRCSFCDSPVEVKTGKGGARSWICPAPDCKGQGLLRSPAGVSKFEKRMSGSGAQAKPDAKPEAKGGLFGFLDS